MPQKCFYVRRHSDKEEPKEIGYVVNQSVVPVGVDPATNMPILVLMNSVLWETNRVSSPDLVPASDCEWVSIPEVTDFEDKMVLTDLLVEEGVILFEDEEGEEEKEEKQK